MNIVAQKISFLVSVFASGCLISMSAIGGDAYTPKNIQKDVNIDLFIDNIGYAMQSSYLAGVTATIATIQNYGIIGKAICLPDSGFTIGMMQDAINALDPAPFPDTNDGGIVYVYSALAAKYPC